MIISLIINVLQLESESLEQLFCRHCGVILLVAKPNPRPRLFDHQFPSYIDYEIYKYKITPAVVGCKDKRKWEPPKL